MTPAVDWIAHSRPRGEELMLSETECASGTFTWSAGSNLWEAAAGGGVAGGVCSNIFGVVVVLAGGDTEVECYADRTIRLVEQDCLPGFACGTTSRTKCPRGTYCPRSKGSNRQAAEPCPGKGLFDYAIVWCVCGYVFYAAVHWQKVI